MRAFLATEWLGLLLLVVVGGAVLAVLQPAFLSGFNLYVLLVSFSLTALVAMAQMVIVAIGQMNLSVGAIGGLAAITFAGSMQVWGLPPLPALLLGLLLGLACGLVNGWLIRLTGISAFIITLATLYVFKGATIGVSQAQPFYGLAESVKWLGNARIGPLPALLAVPAVVLPLMGLLMTRSVIGRQMLAYGGNPSAAELSGIDTGRVVVIAHALSGVLAALAGMLVAARLQAGQPSIGEEWLIISFAAPVLGGAALTGGHVSVIGTALGVLVVSLINNALVLFGVDPFFVQLFLGALILAAVSLNRLREVRLSPAAQA